MRTPAFFRFVASAAGCLANESCSPRRPARIWIPLFSALVLAWSSSAPAAPYLACTVEISGDANTPRITVWNNSRDLQITNFSMTVGNPAKGFDYAYNLQAPPYGGIQMVSPGTTSGDNVTSPTINMNLSGFDPGESFSFYVDLDAAGGNTGENYKTNFFNNGNLPNSVVAIQGTGLSATLTLPDSSSSLSTYTFSIPRPPRTLRVKSLTEANLPVSKVTVHINDVIWTNTLGVFTTNIGQEVTIPVVDGDTVEISAPQQVYKDIFGVDITDSVGNDPQQIQEKAQERFSAIGISVNDVPQTGDPTLYRFEISENSVIVVKWRHEYALTVAHDFTQTESLEKDAANQPWAGPLISEAVGNPDPAAKKHWIRRGEEMIAQVDGQVLDFSRPGLDLRYVVKNFRAFGPPNPATTANEDNTLRASQVDIRTNPASVTNIQFSVGQSPPRQQVPRFTMYGPGGITYTWQIQYGVRVNVDDPTRAALPKIFTNSGSAFIEAGNLEGTFWFNPGTVLRVASAANLGGPNSLALGGWFNGDGYYFSSNGEIDSSNGGLISGGPHIGENGPVATWITEFFDSSGKRYRGLEIPNLQRAARVQWRYGGQQLRVEARIGEYVFQGSDYEPAFVQPPDQITVVSVTGSNPNAGPADMAVWDPEAARLYPLVPGIFKALWRSTNAPDQLVEVFVTATYPIPAHYPHIADTPPVALDPDPNDNFIFKALKYTENQAVVDQNKFFLASQRGKSVLLFSEIQRVGRGEPREFLRVRVVDTKLWADGVTTGSAVIGRKIADSSFDQARLGTGFIMFQNARYNPFIYDAAKLDGLAAKNIYNMAALRSGSGSKIVVQKNNLPGPIIPVNLHPGADNTQRVVVVWYDDPIKNDELLWPHRARIYLPRWPADESEGLGRIVIASQFGSESVGTNSADQIVADGLTNLVADSLGNLVPKITPAETTYNPSRLQQVQVYVQSDPDQPGYNPNEEHALTAPSLRYAEVSPRPPAIYALRQNDLNNYNRSNSEFAESLETPASYTSHPFVLAQFLDTAENEYKMRVYQVVKEDANFPNYSFATPSRLVSTTAPRLLQAEPHIVMEAGEPVIPFYPLGEVIGASPCAQSFGTNLKGQTVYWEDHKGSSWAVSGGEDAWFTVSFHYPLLPNFWWPSNAPGFIREIVEGDVTIKKAAVPQTGDCVSFLPSVVSSLLALAPEATIDDSSTVLTDVNPTRVLYKSDWPSLAPVLKAGETLTFQGGEYRADHPFIQIAEEGELVTAETPGLPGIVAFAAGEVVFDSLNPLADTQGWVTNWTARVAQVLDRRSVPLTLAQFPADLQPATKRTRVKQGKYVFNDLPASLQNRVRYDPLAGKLEIVGLLNEKEIGDATLTAAPPAVYALEPNIITPEEEQKLAALSENETWLTRVEELARLSRNPGLLDSDNTSIPDPSATDYRTQLETFWRDYYQLIGGIAPGREVPLPVEILDSDASYLVGLEPKLLRDSTDKIITLPDPVFEGIQREIRDPRQPAPMRAFGPGLALLPNPDFLNPSAGLPEISWITVAENNDPSLGGSPITLHVIKVDRRERYRGAIKTVVSDNVFDENLVLRHTGDFGANADALAFEWWYRPDDGSLNVPPPDLLQPGQANPWKLFPDPSGNRGIGRFQVTLKGNPNAPEALLADSWWFVRYRHTNDVAEGTNWKVPQSDNSPAVNFTWAGAGNSDPFNDFDADGFPDFRAQLAQGWIKRVLDAVNPYEARIRDFEGESPSTLASMISQFGPRFEGPVALNPDKNVIENVGLIELYETILNRGRSLSIDLSRPVSTPAVANALQLVSTRISDFYTVLGNEAYVDALDPTIGIGSDSVEPGSLSPAVFSFQNQMSSLLEEELSLLRGVDDYFARPVYNRLFWNFTKGEGEAAYANNYNVTDINHDGFIDEDDAMVLYPQGHGDAWGHYLTATRNQYDLLKHPYFNWVSRSEFYNLQDIVIKVDFLDERKFAQVAASKAKTGAEIVNLTYRAHYVEDPNAQWQGYTDSNKDRSWGVQEWARRAGQGAYFDWITANALLPSQHPNQQTEGIQKVDRTVNSDIAVVSANLNAIQQTFDQANKGENPLGAARNVIPFDINPILIEDLSIYGRTHFEQVYERALKALANALAVWENANETRNHLRAVANSEAEFRNSVFQEDLSYRNQLIQIFGKPYDGTIGSGKIYPAGYDGPDLLLHMYVDVRKIDNTTVPRPTSTFATFDENGVLSDGDIYQAFVNGVGNGNSGRAALTKLSEFHNNVRSLFAPTFALDGTIANSAPLYSSNGWYSVNYTDLVNPKVPLENLTQLLPVSTAGYTFQAPRDWGERVVEGELQSLLNQMIQQEAAVASAIAAWDALQGSIVRQLRFVNAKLDFAANIRLKNELFSRLKIVVMDIIKGFETGIEIHEGLKDTSEAFWEATSDSLPKNMPTAGLAFSPGDALSAPAAALKLTGIAVKGGIEASEVIIKVAKLIAEISIELAENELDLFEKREQDALDAKEMLKELENLVGDEPIKRVEIFKEIQALRGLSAQYRAKLDEGTRLIDERAAFNKRVAAQTQRNRYQDLTFRVSRNHALQSYRAAFNLAARYAYLAARAYDYETNFDPADPGSPRAIYGEILRARTLGEYAEGEPGDARLSKGGLAAAMAWLKINYEAQKNQLGINNPQTETGKISLRTELFRVLPKNAEGGTNSQPDLDGFPLAGMNSDLVWSNILQAAKVDDLWQIPEFRYYCRPFAAETDAAGSHVPEPGIVLRFSTRIFAGQNFFGKPLSGGDHAYDPSQYATKIRSVGVWFSDYLSGDVLNDLPAAPRAYLVPVGLDVMSVPTSENPSLVRMWKVVDQRIPVPFPALTADLDKASYIPLLDSLNGRLGEPRKFSMLRAYHDGGSEINLDELVSDSRLIGRSVWNTQWLLIIPGRLLNADPNAGLERFIQQISDIKLVFQTYGYSGG